MNKGRTYFEKTNNLNQTEEDVTLADSQKLKDSKTLQPKPEEERKREEDLVTTLHLHKEQIIKQIIANNPSLKKEGRDVKLLNAYKRMPLKLIKALKDISNTLVKNKTITNRNQLKLEKNPSSLRKQTAQVHEHLKALSQISSIAKVLYNRDITQTLQKKKKKKKKKNYRNIKGSGLQFAFISIIEQLTVTMEELEERYKNQNQNKNHSDTKPLSHLEREKARTNARLSSNQSIGR